MSSTETSMETPSHEDSALLIDVEKETKKLVRLRNKALVKAATSTDPDTIRRYERLRNDRILRSERYKQDQIVHWKEKGRVDLIPKDDNFGRMANRLAQAKTGNSEITRQHNARSRYVLQLKKIRGSGGFKDSVTPYGFQKLSSEGQNLEIEPMSSVTQKPETSQPNVQPLKTPVHHPLAPSPPTSQHFSSINPTIQSNFGPKQPFVPPFQLAFTFPFSAGAPPPPPTPFPPPPQPIAVGVIQPKNNRKKARKRPKIEY
ncbi:BA75_03185T0 [Komagataella pastoris]|uniref:BA75_03185T0 n=1 Tax=Komagataella pastoris TaxID=4922 RepID=A0A1B2JB96_PICPA|nr:BA75_03185T0 [Komagataella pastoris]